MTKRHALGLFFAIALGACSGGESDDADDGPPGGSASLRADAGPAPGAARCPPAAPNARGVGKACSKDGDCAGGTTCNTQAPEPYCSFSEGPSETASCDRLTCGAGAACCTFATPIGQVATCVPTGCTPPAGAVCR